MLHRKTGEEVPNSWGSKSQTWRHQKCWSHSFESFDLIHFGNWQVTLDQKVVTPKCLFLEESMKIQMYPNGLRLGFTNSFKLPGIKKTPSNPTSWQVGLAVKATIRAADVSASKTFPQVTGSDQKRTDVNIWKKARRFPTWEIFRYQFCLRGGCKML